MPTIIACSRGRDAWAKARLVPMESGSDEAPRPSKIERRVSITRAPPCAEPSAVCDFDPPQYLIDLRLRIVGRICQGQGLAAPTAVRINAGGRIAMLDKVA